MARFTRIPLAAAQGSADTRKRPASGQPRRSVKTGAFAEAYPHLSRWVEGCGWIEVGDDGSRPSLIRVLDEGGMVWEGSSHYASVDEALHEAEAAVAQWMREQYGE
jgi:hypothetical protein